MEDASSFKRLHISKVAQRNAGILWLGKHFFFRGPLFSALSLQEHDLLPR